MKILSTIKHSQIVRVLLIIVVFVLMTLFVANQTLEGIRQGRQGIIDFYNLQLDLLAGKLQTISPSRRGEDELQDILAATQSTALRIQYVYTARNDQVEAHSFSGAFPGQLLNPERNLDLTTSVEIVNLGDSSFYDFARLYSVQSSRAVHIGVPREVIDSVVFDSTMLPAIIFSAMAVIASIAAMYLLMPKPGHARPVTVKRDDGGSQPRWRELFLNAPAVSVLYHAKTGEIQEVNRAFLEMGGYRAGSITGRQIGEFLVPAEDESIPLSMIDDVHPDNTVYLKSKKRGLIPLHAEGQQVYIGDSLFQLVSAFEITELISYQQNLRTQRNEQSTRATQDKLTGLFNRLGIEGHAQAELNRSERGEPLTVLLLDIDHFKRINDTYGHDAGDRVLHRVAEVISHTKRPYDWAGRWGGEEFLVLLPGTGLLQGVQAAERIRAAIATTAMHVARGKDEQITISIGVASTEQDSADTHQLTELVKTADGALYNAKESGRNRVIAWHGGGHVHHSDLI